MPQNSALRASAGEMPALRLQCVLALCLLLVVTTFAQPTETGHVPSLPESGQPAAAATYDTVILNGRVMDPESGTDAVRNVGIQGGKIAAITTEAIRGRNTIDAHGLVVAPGFIDLHSHGQDDENYRYKAMDGVTTALELEVGVGDVDRWYGEREGKALINFGASAGHIPARMALMHDTGGLLPRDRAINTSATPEQIATLVQDIRRGLERGAIGVGMGIQYVPGASHWEVLQVFRAAHDFGGPVFVHIRGMGPGEPTGAVDAVEEVIADAVVTATPLHIVHISSSGLSVADQLLSIVGEARQRGVDVTTECYPYTAAMTDLSSALFAEGWQKIFGIDYGGLQWAKTGERLNQETFAKYRKEGGMVIIHAIPEAVAKLAVASPLTMIASDGVITAGKGHPRGAGTYARVLGVYVREQHALTLMDALRKMTLMPAQRLEARVPAMKNKGRVRMGADADLTVFDPARVIDRATFDNPAQYSSGIQYVLVGGTPVVRDGALASGVFPGRGIRAPIAAPAAATRARP
jgi:dihydroorotase